MEEPKETRITLRLPADLHEEVQRFARGNGKRPPSSLNATIVFLLRSGLSAEQRKSKSENEPGQWAPELLVAA